MSVQINKYLKTRKKKEEFIILYDDREDIIRSNELFLKAINNANNNLKIPIKVVKSRLFLGDYAVKDLVFERKTIFDLIASIRYGDRMLSQFNSMQQALQNNKNLQCFLCIIGNPDTDIIRYLTNLRKRGKLSTDQDFTKEYIRIRRSINAIIAKFNIYGIYASIFQTMEDFAYFILKCIDYRYIKENKYEVVQRYRVNINKDIDINKEVTIAMLKAIPNIGDEIARRLVDRFNTIENICNASVEEIQEVTAPASVSERDKKKNIKIASTIYNSLRGCYKK